MAEQQWINLSTGQMATLRAINDDPGIGVARLAEVAATAKTDRGRRRQVKQWADRLVALDFCAEHRHPGVGETASVRYSYTIMRLGYQYLCDPENIGPKVDWDKGGWR